VRSYQLALIIPGISPRIAISRILLRMKSAAVSFAAPVLGLDTSGALGEKFQQQPGFQPPAGMLFRAGGVVIKLDNEVVGAIGVGGAPSAGNDETCARAGIAKIRDRLK